MKWSSPGHEYDEMYDEIEKRESFYLFGGGDYGRQFLNIFKTEIHIKGFIDNDPSKQGNAIKGIHCYSLEDIENGHFHLLTLEEAFAHFEHYVVDDENIVIHGKLIKSDIDHQVVIMSKEGKVLAVYGPNGQGYLKSIRGLF